MNNKFNFSSPVKSQEVIIASAKEIISVNLDSISGKDIATEHVAPSSDAPVKLIVTATGVSDYGYSELLPPVSTNVSEIDGNTVASNGNGALGVDIVAVDNDPVTSDVGVPVNVTATNE